MPNSIRNNFISSHKPHLGQMASASTIQGFLLFNSNPFRYAAYSQLQPSDFRCVTVVICYLLGKALQSWETGKLGIRTMSSVDYREDGQTAQPAAQSLSTGRRSAWIGRRCACTDSSLADPYDDTTMPQELRQAHLANDRAVMKAYGFAPTSAEAEIVTKLFALYEALAKQA